MSCYHPLYRASEYSAPVLHSAWLRRRVRNGGVVLSQTDYDSLLVQEQKYFQRIPCGKCIGCRLSYSRQWADRITLESILYPEESNFFLTITYNDIFLPGVRNVLDSETGEVGVLNPLCKSDLQKFFKRVRRNYKLRYGLDLNLRYFACGEYGDKNGRPHYHVCVLNMPLPDLKVSERFSQKRYGKVVSPLYESEFLNSCWTERLSSGKFLKGHIVVGRLTWSSAAYVARYIFKKQLGKSSERYRVFDSDMENSDDYPDSFTCMSLKPGIGYPYFEQHIPSLIVEDVVYVPVKGGVQKRKPPRYFDFKLKEVQPEVIDEIRAERRSVAISARLMELEQVSMSEVEFLEKAESMKMRSLSRLYRTL